jgi:SAM-dependent methyltransferase
MEKRWQNHEGTILDQKNGFDIIECKPCDFIHCVPIPSPEELKNVYRDDYYSAEKPLYFERMKEDLDWWKLAYADRFETFENHLPSGRRKLLDVGSGPGYFLKQGKERGWDALGIEPSKQAAAYSRTLGLNIIEEFLTPALAERVGMVDAANLSETLEHIPDPAAMLRLIHRIISPGGMLCVVVPNDYNPFQHVLRTACQFDPWWIAAPHHINYFTHSSLHRLFERTGFEVVLLESTFPIDLFLLFGDNYVGNDGIGRACHGRRKTLELNLSRAGSNFLKRQLYRKFAELGIGREIVAFGKKKK